jgi:serine/threonine-protein kinase RsbW
MELSFPSELGYEVIARDAVAAFARRLGLAPTRIEDLKTALCEACINAIEHGNSLEPGLRVRILCAVEDEQLVVEVCDELAGLGSLRGMGLMLISQLCDESGFVSRTDSGNCFRFTFHRQAGPSFSTR